MVVFNGVRMSREKLVGDPFLGAIAGGLFRAGVGALRRRFAPKPITGAIAIRGAPGAITAPGVRVLPGAGAIAGTMIPLPVRVAAAAGQRMLFGPGGRRLPSGFADTREFGARRRRMNPLNPRALRRALSRAGAFEKFCRRTLVITKRVKLKKRGKR